METAGQTDAKTKKKNRRGGKSHKKSMPPIVEVKNNAQKDTQEDAQKNTQNNEQKDTRKDPQKNIQNQAHQVESHPKTNSHITALSKPVRKFQLNGWKNHANIADCLQESYLHKILVFQGSCKWKLIPKTINESDKWGVDAEYKLCKLSKLYNDCNDPGEIFWVEQLISGSAFLWFMFIQFYENQEFIDYEVLNQFLRKEHNNITDAFAQEIQRVIIEHRQVPQTMILNMLSVDRIRHVYNRNQLLHVFGDN
jgi:hypothetical protein